MNVGTGVPLSLGELLCSVFADNKGIILGNEAVGRG